MTAPVKDYTFAKSRMRGVYANANGWTASICVNYKQIYLGYFSTRDAAKAARLAAEKQHYGNLSLDSAKKIPGYDGYYILPNGSVIGRHGRVLASWIDKDGYVHSNLARGVGTKAVRRRIAQHILVCLAYHGPKPTPMHEVRHLDGSKTNNDPGNLCWGTHYENMQDRYRHGTYTRNK